MHPTRVPLRLSQVVLIGLGVVAGGVVVALLNNGGLAPPAILSGLAIGFVVALCWPEIRRLRAIMTVARRLADSELGVAIDDPGDGVLGDFARSINSVSAKLTDAHNTATTDLLTQVANRGGVLSTLSMEVGRAVRYGRPLSVAFVDLDHFKVVNDSHGHQVGDVVLRCVADLFRTNLRQTDVVGRYGGDEFMIVLPETGPAAATEVAEKLRLLVQTASFDASPGLSIELTVSVGIAGGQGKALGAEALVRDADQAMYAAKSLGRNQTYVFEEPDDDSRIPSTRISSAGRARAKEVTAIVRQATEAALSGVISPLPHYRGKPSMLIATVSVAIARELRLPDHEIERIRVAALLHDIGKIAVPEHILEKPSSLTATEWDSVKQHPRIGQVILDEAGGLADVGKIILHHHERFGGNGYPHGLRGQEIPVGSRIVSIADAYDAMIQDRPYKRAIGHDDALAELRRHAGMQFDPELVDVFARLYAKRAPVVDRKLLMARDAGTRRLLRAQRHATA